MKEKCRLIKTIVTLFSIAFLFVFSVLAYNGSFAWMAQSTDVDANGITITAKNDSIIKTIKYYRVTNTAIDTSGAEKKNIYKFGYNENVLKTQYVYGQEENKMQERYSFEESISMRPYSELSGDCQVLVEIALLQKVSSITIKMETATKEFLGDTVENKINNKSYDLQPDNLPLSSVVHFAVFSSLDVENEEFLVHEADMVNEVCFVGGNATDGYTFSANLSDIVVNLPESNEESKFYILFDYKSAIVQYINDKIIEYVNEATAFATSNGGIYDTILLGETNLCFVPDFEIKIETGGN